MCHLKEAIFLPLLGAMFDYKTQMTGTQGYEEHRSFHVNPTYHRNYRTSFSSSQKKTANGILTSVKDEDSQKEEKKYVSSCMGFDHHPLWSSQVLKVPKEPMKLRSLSSSVANRHRQSCTHSHLLPNLDFRCPLHPNVITSSSRNNRFSSEHSASRSQIFFSA